MQNENANADSGASKPAAPLSPGAAEQQMRRLSRRSFVVGAAAALGGLGAWGWLTKIAEKEDYMPWPLRRVLRFNEGLAESLGSPHGLAPTFPPESVQGSARVNGCIGLGGESTRGGEGWELLVRHADRPERMFALREVQELPRMDLVTELKCVEGWSQVMHFGGVTFLDFVTAFGLATRSGRAPDPLGDPQDLYRYVYLATPDESYYVGLDMASALHPQTLLCDTMNWERLTTQHGAPLRLYLSVKYGFKSIKNLGVIRFQDERPRDFWADRAGYDWYAGL